MAYRVKYKNRNTFYFKKASNMRGYGAPANLNKANLGREVSPRFIPDESIDMRKRENMDMMESLRGPREKDFYQDHTYHDQWEERSLDKGQAAQMRERYYFFQEGYQVKPWVWHPGDIVEVIEGPQTGQRGSIIAVVPYKNEIIVQNINVKDVTIPGGDGRPEQVVQREHPILCTITKHVDPSTGDLCTLKLIRVNSKLTEQEIAEGKEPEVEERRISMESGTILPIPPRTASNNVETGDPLRDTPYQDALDTSYEKDQEMGVLVERKLAALEAHFVASLKASHHFHAQRQQANAQQMRDFQRDALSNAVNSVKKSLLRDADSLDDWWFEELAPHMEIIEQKAAAKAEARAARRAASLDAAQRAQEDALAAEADEEFEEDEEGEEEHDGEPSDSNDSSSSEKRA